MPCSKRSHHSFDSILLGELLLGALLLVPAAPARAGDDERDGRLAAREVLEDFHEEVQERERFFYGDDEAPDLVRERGPRLRGDRVGSFEDPEQARRLLSEELLDRLEDRLNRGFNEGRWIPFWHRDDRKGSGPEILFGLDDPAPGPAAATDSWRSRFRLSLVRGLEYRQDFATSQPNRKLQMRVFGPVVPGGAGLGFQLKGHVLDHRFRLNAYGGTNEAGLTVDLEF